MSLPGGRLLSAVGGDLEGTADLAHSGSAEGAKALDQHCHGHRFDRVEVDRASTSERIISRLEDDFTR